MRPARSHTHVVIPYGGAEPARERALDWALAAYARRLPTYRVTVARHDGDPWCKAQAVMPALHALAGDPVVVVADADVWCAQLAAAVEAIGDGWAWARPHRRVVRLTEAATALWCAGTTNGGHEDILDAYARRPYRGEDGGGFVVARRSTLLSTPFDKRFTGWGQEDSAIGAALHTLHDVPFVGRGTLVHLWHPPAPRITARKGSEGGWALWLAYSRARARRDPEAMRRLLAEAWP